MLLDCSPAWVTQPPATCSTAPGWMPARSSSAVWAAPRISAACSPARTPPRLPIGVRTASTITAVPTAVPPFGRLHPILERVLISARADVPVARSAWLNREERVTAGGSDGRAGHSRGLRLHRSRPLRQPGARGGTRRTAADGARLVERPAPRRLRLRRRGVLGRHQARGRAGGVPQQRGVLQ